MRRATLATLILVSMPLLIVHSAVAQHGLANHELTHTTQQSGQQSDTPSAGAHKPPAAFKNRSSTSRTAGDEAGDVVDVPPRGPAASTPSGTRDVTIKGSKILQN